MSRLLSGFTNLALSFALADAAALVPAPAPPQPYLPVAGLEANQGQATTGILFLCPESTGSIAVTPQSVSYSPLGATLSLVASNPNPPVSFSDPLPGIVNSYAGADPQKWVTGITRYASATLGSVYAGTNFQYTVAANGALTLNMLLAAGIDPKEITFQIAQAGPIAVASN